jgi:OHCU decarboxylase
METIRVLNSLSHSEFAAALRPLFEAAAPLAEALYAERPFASYEALIDRAEALALGMPFDQQVAVLSAHPRIGANPATLSAASLREQGAAAEAGMDPAINAELADLNARYEKKFGFRFVVFVNRRPKSEIVEVLRKRIERSRDEELATGLRDMFSIARDRPAPTS